MHNNAASLRQYLRNWRHNVPGHTYIHAYIGPAEDTPGVPRVLRDWHYHRLIVNETVKSHYLLEGNVYLIGTEGGGRNCVLLCWRMTRKLQQLNSLRKRVTFSIFFFFILSCCVPLFQYTNAYVGNAPRDQLDRLQ
eukprot:TRINITY_DN1628_c1_g1_i1.p1 TRINITY_DN1628_c1_g1~~TRINITY_DN1628_c1_g1_i1.p1  ORF type:complete len:136 (-),score=7.87 TRINITY_DN1628_c1_g1_i1:251-658(-)